ncbi:alpha/beta hydrolase [Comamonadaceae bacterium G21597-S1]|nr:alpha/beta hydrolase [Comamonadaceae bacterium G21597-S1]
MPDPTILLLPGWQNSGPDHWQSRWERRHGYVRVEQHDWMHPLRGDWVARLQDVVLEHEQDRAPDAPARIVLVAHSLGCQLVAAWAAHSGLAHRIRAALLVAPGDPQTEAVAAVLASWSPVVLQTLPFPSVLIGSQDDPYCRIDRARHFAANWGSQFVDYGNAGHINADSGLGDWPDGHDRLLELCRASGAQTAAARPPPQ